jgi:mRNA-degrading endonuclease RelE of RelBE toxin-antitoxin system
VAYQIAYSPGAERDLRYLAKRDEVLVRRSAVRDLAQEPAAPSRKRKRLDPNPLGVSWDLRLGDLRVFYDVEEEPVPRVRVQRIGRKDRERLFMRGAPVEMRTDGV